MDKGTYSFYLFLYLAAFMTLKLDLFPKKSQKSFLILPFFFFFVHLLPSLINEESYNTSSELEEGTIEHILRAKTWLYGYDSVLLQILIQLFLLSLYCSFEPLKIFNKDTSQCPSIEALLIVSLWGYFNCFLMVFFFLKLIVFQKNNEFFNFTVVVVFV